MFYLKRSESTRDFNRKKLMRGIHMEKKGVTPRRWNFERVEYAGFRRLLQIRHVGMPGVLARSQAADGLAVFYYVRHDVNFRISFDKAAPGFLDRGQIQPSGLIAECNEIGVR